MEFFAQMLMGALAEGAWIVSPTGEMVVSNPAAHQLLRQDAHGHLQPFPEDGEKAWQKAYSQVQASGQSAQLYWYARASAQLLNVTMTPLVALDGAIQGILGIARTDQAPPIEPVPKDVHDLLERVIHFMPNPVFVKDRYHRWIILNDAFSSFFGKHRDVMLGKSDYDFFPPEEADVFWEHDNQVFTTGTSNENEESFTDADGVQRWILTRKSVFLDTEGNPILVGVITDLTERKRAEEAMHQAMRKMEEASQAKSDFLAKMSHELRTPMNSILGFTTLMLKNREQTLTERELDFLMRIHRNGLHLLNLINDILDLSRVESGKIPFHFETIELAALLLEVIDAFEVQAQEKGLILKTELAPVLPFATDRERLKQILLNLVGNAIKFTPSGSVKIRLLADSQGRAREIAVIDTGLGIPSEQQDLVFDAFHQIDQSSKRSYGGTGLGLAIVRNLCQNLGYGLELVSTPSRGSCFRLLLQETD